MQLIIYLLVFMLLIVPLPAGAQILFYDDCENTPLYGTDWNKNGDTGDNTFSVSGTYKRAGTNSYKFHIASCTASNSCSSPTNVELILRGLNSPVPINNFTFGQEYWIGFSVYFPAGTDLSAYPANLGLSMQFHAANDACDQLPIIQPLSLGNLGGAETSGHWDINSATYGTNLCSTLAEVSTNSWEGPFNKGSWNDVVMHLKFNYTADAFTRIWINGTQYVNATGANAKNDAKGPYLKMGIYGQFLNAIDVYYDEFKAGDQNSSYDEVAPGGAVNQAPTVTMTPGTTQTIAQNDNVNFSCVPADSDGTIASILWDFDDSGIAQSTVEDPGNKQFTQVGTFNVRVTVTDNDGATAYDEVTVIVGAGGITGLISNHDFESGAEGTDNEANMAYTINGGAVVEGVGTEPNPPGYGTVGLVLDGTNDYVSAASYHASAPWQTGQAVGTFILAYKTPSTDTTAEMYFGGRYNDTTNNRTIGLLVGTYTGLQPWMKIGYNSGASHEDKYFGTNLSTSTRYVTIFRIDATQKLWKIDTYNYDTSTWLTSASGSITNDMYLAGTAAWELGRRPSGAYFNGTIYYDFLYNTWLTDGEIVEIAEGTYEEPPVFSNVIDSMCFADCSTETCYGSDHVFHTGQNICLKVIYGLNGAYNFTGSYSDFYWPFTLSGSGTLTLRYKSGLGTNKWVFYDIIDSGDVETSDVVLSNVADFVKGSATIVNESGVELTNYNAPSVNFDSNKMTIVGGPHIYFDSE